MLNANKGALRRNAVHWPHSRNSSVRNACATFSGRTNCSVLSNDRPYKCNNIANLVQLVAQINWVYVIAF